MLKASPDRASTRLEDVLCVDKEAKILDTEAKVDYQSARHSNILSKLYQMPLTSGETNKQRANGKQQN